MDISSFLFSPVTWLVSAVSAIYLLYWYGTATFNYFSDQGIPGPKPLPYCGNTWGLWKENIPKYDREMVAKYGRIFGYFDGTLPNLWTTDVDLIKSVFVKDFDHFVNRRDFTITRKVFRKMVSIIRNKEWKDVRSSITPVFSTGKIKLMSVMIKQCADRLVEKLEHVAENEGQLDAKHLLGAFTMDVIARCAFGMAINSLGEKDDPFMTKAKAVFNPAANKSPAILIAFMFPKLMATFADRLFFPNDFYFFINMLEDIIKQRTNSTENYHDFIEVATSAISSFTKVENGKEMPLWNMEEVNEIVTAQSLVFLLAGFDTTATTLTNTVFLLARNPEIQNRLYQETMRKRHQFGEISHDTILDFPYVDHVINEVLRMYPPVPRIERGCNKDFTYNGIHVKQGMVVTVPTYGLHYDEEYYPDANKFNPDRWNPESEITPNPYAFMPFGMGPRNCIGVRFAMEEMKIALCTIVEKFRFFPVAETPEKVQFEDGFLGVVQHVNAVIGVEPRFSPE